MVDPVEGRNLQNMLDFEAAYQSGNVDEHQEQLYRILVRRQVARVSKWQAVIHGPTHAYRIAVVDALLEDSDFKKARRFAFCGRSDQMARNAETNAVCVKPAGCGCRFCPRCSRRAGRKFLARVQEHLAQFPHGSLVHFVLTQPVDNSETLEQTKERFKKAWTKFYSRMRDYGMINALATYHVKRASAGGWHYHCHLFAEMNGELKEDAKEGIDDAWQTALGDYQGHRFPLFMRLVCGPGGPLSELSENQQTEFWCEASSEVGKVIQYILRDALQGVESWIGEVSGSVTLTEFMKALHGGKLHRLYGSWRKVIEVEEEDGGEAKMTTVVPDVVRKSSVWTAIGRMDGVLWNARQGNQEAREAIMALVHRCGNASALSQRLIQLAREVCS